MTYKELVGYINEELNVLVPNSGCTVITTKPDVDIDTVLTFSVETVLGTLTATLSGYLKLICSFAVDSTAIMMDVANAVTTAIAEHYKPTAEGYIIGDYNETTYSYVERPSIAYYDADHPFINVDIPVVAREYHRVEVPAAFDFAMDYNVTEAPADDDTGDEES